MSTILAATSQADSATTTTSVFAFTSAETITATCACAAATPPSQQCQVILYLSADNLTFYEVDTRWFNINGTSFQRFHLADYTGLPGNYGLTAPWAYYKLKFTGNVGAAVTVSAVFTTQRQFAKVTLAGINGTTAGGLGSWSPPQGGPIFITSMIVAPSANSTGSSTLNAGVAANAATSSAGLINASQLNASANTAIFSGTGTAATVGAVLTGTQAVTFTTNANSSGFAGTAYIEYVSP